MTSYQSFKLLKSHKSQEDLLCINSNNDKLKQDFNVYIEQQSHHNLPLQFPKTDGMRIAFGQPSSRQQVELLMTWFDHQISKSVNDTLQDNQAKQQTLLTKDNDFQKEMKLQDANREQLGNSINEILDFTLVELISQVGVQCQERGFLLSKTVQMLLALKQDLMNQLIQEKKVLTLKAVSHITHLKQHHEQEIQDTKDHHKDMYQQLKHLIAEKEEWMERQSKMDHQMADLKQAKRQLKKINNHLIDSLVIKANQIKFADRQFRFKVINQLDDIKDKQSQSELANTENYNSQQTAEGFHKKILSSRRGSRLFKPTENEDMKKVQDQLRDRIATRVKKLLNKSYGDSDSEESHIQVAKQGYNPEGNVNSGLQYLKQNIEDKIKLEKLDTEKDIKRILSKKHKVQNLHGAASLFVKTKQETNTNEQLPLNVKNFNQGFATIESIRVMDPMTPRVLPNSPKKQKRSSFILAHPQPIPIKASQESQREYSMLKNLKSNELSQFLNNNNQTESQDHQSSISYDDVGLQFPENDVLNASDFLERPKTPEVLILQEEQIADKKPKFTKKEPPSNSKTNKQIVVDLSLKDFSAAASQHKASQKEEIDEQDNFQIIEQSEGSSRSSQTMKSDYGAQKDKQSDNEEDPDMNKTGNIMLQTTDSKKQKQNHQRQEMQKFLENNNDAQIEQAQDLLRDQNEINETYEQLDDKNSIFHQHAFNMDDAQDAQSHHYKLKDAFVDKVDTIVDTVLANVQQSKVSKRQLLQLVVSNVLKNEQEQIKQLVIDQIFGPTSTTTTPPDSNALSRAITPASALMASSRVDSKAIGAYNLPGYLLSKYRDEGVQTDSLLMIDFLDCGVQPAELYKYERKGGKLLKYTFEREQDQDIVKQQEFITKQDLYSMENSKKKEANTVNDKLEGLARGAKLEIDRSNMILAELLNKIRELQENIDTLEERKAELMEDLDVNHQVKDRFIQQFDLWINSWHKGFVVGFERGMSNGYFKGAVENKDYGIQEGFQLGIKEGWSFGFDDGFKNGVRKVYQEAKEKGLDVTLLTPVLNLYLSQSEKRQGIQLQIQQKLFKISSFKLLAPVVRAYIAKFNLYNEKKKKTYAKLGLKTVLKLIKQYFTAKFGNRDFLLSEFIFEECQKKFGHNKMASKAFMQFLASSFYHNSMHPKISVCCSFLHINEKPYSQEVCTFYLQILEGLSVSTLGMKNEYDEKTDREAISMIKASEVMKELFECMMPQEVVAELRLRLEKLKIKGQKTKSAQIDMDKYLDFMIRSYIKFHVDLINKPQIVYFAWTLYERNHLTANELHLTLEILGGDTLKMISELREHIQLQKKDLLKLFEEGCREEDLILIRYLQFSEIIKDSDLFHTRKARELFSQLPFRQNIAKFQEIFNERSKHMKELIADIYQNQDIFDRMEHMDTKDYWYDRIYAIERNIGEVNSTVLYLSLIFALESLKHLKFYKDNTIRALWEEKHGKKAPANVELLSEDMLFGQKPVQLKEKSIKIQIQKKIHEVTEAASPTFLKRAKKPYISPTRLL